MSDSRAGLQGSVLGERPYSGGRRSAQDTRIDPEAESEHEPRRAVFSAIVEDEPGVFSRVAGLATRRQSNIESLIAGPTTVGDHSHITMVIKEPEPGINQIERQLAELKPVISAGELDDDAVRAEFIPLRIRGEDPDKVHTITETYDGHILNVSPETITVQLTGGKRKIDDIVDAFRRFGTIEIARTGQATLTHGSKKTAPGEESGTSGEPTKPNTNTQ